MSEQRDHPGEAPIPSDSYLAWWANAQAEQDAEVQRLRAEIERQYDEASKS